jgi:hypothetical protein
MTMTTFANLLIKYMGRINASENWLGNKIGFKGGQTINNWKNGKFMPNSNHPERIIACAKALLLNEKETNEFLIAAGFAQEYMLVDNKSSEGIFVDFIRKLLIKLSQLNPYPVMLLLTQANLGEPPFREALLAQAKAVYSPENVLHLQPPYSTSADVNTYFADLGKQCELESVTDDCDFEQALQARLEQSECLFLLVSRFDQGVPALREQLAGMLRSLSDRFTQQLHVIFCGGEKLARLKYQQGDLSLLNIATVEQWPELGRNEVYALRDYHFNGLQLDDKLVEQLLTISGAHPQLLNECLNLRQQEPSLPLPAYPQRLSQCQCIWTALVPFTQDSTNRHRIEQLLQQDLLVKAQPFILDPLLRRLYWNNVLVERETNKEKYLYWRCEALKIGGRNILEAF